MSSVTIGEAAVPLAYRAPSAMVIVPQFQMLGAVPERWTPGSIVSVDEAKTTLPLIMYGLPCNVQWVSRVMVPPLILVCAWTESAMPRSARAPAAQAAKKHLQICLNVCINSLSSSKRTA